MPEEEPDDSTPTDQTITVPDMYAELGVWSNFSDLKESALQAVETIREADKTDRASFYKEVTEEVQTIALYFIWSNLLVEDLLISYLESRLIGPENMTPELRNYIRGHQFSFDQLRKFLYYSNVIDDSGLNGEIKRNRNIRNEIIHNPTSLVAFDIDIVDVPHLDSEIERAYGLISKLFEI